MALSCAIRTIFYRLDWVGKFITRKPIVINLFDKFQLVLLLLFLLFMLLFLLLWLLFFMLNVLCLTLNFSKKGEKKRLKLLKLLLFAT